MREVGLSSKREEEREQVGLGEEDYMAVYFPLKCPNLTVGSIF